eukprot:gene22053-28148_t
MTTRTALLTVSVILHFINFPVTRLFEVILQIAVVVQLVHGILAVADVYRTVFAHNRNVFGMLKLLLLKLLVLLIALQDLVVSLLVRFEGGAGAAHLVGGHHRSEEDRLARKICALILIEYTVLAPLVYFAFAKSISTPRVPYALFVSREQEQEGVREDGQSGMGWFLRQVLTVWDVFGLLDLPANYHRAVGGGSDDDDGSVTSNNVKEMLNCAKA